MKLIVYMTPLSSHKKKHGINYNKEKTGNIYANIYNKNINFKKSCGSRKHR